MPRHSVSQRLYERAMEGVTGRTTAAGFVPGPGYLESVAAARRALGVQRPGFFARAGARANRAAMYAWPTVRGGAAAVGRTFGVGLGAYAQQARHLGSTFVGAAMNYGTRGIGLARSLGQAAAPRIRGLIGAAGREAGLFASVVGDLPGMPQVWRGMQRLGTNLRADFRMGMRGIRRAGRTAMGWAEPQARWMGQQVTRAVGAAGRAASWAWGSAPTIHTGINRGVTTVAGRTGLRNLPGAIARGARGVGGFFEMITRPQAKIPFGEGAPWERQLKLAGRGLGRAGISTANWMGAVGGAIGRGIAGFTQMGPSFSYQRPWIGATRPGFGEIRSGLRGMQNLVPSNLPGRFRAAAITDRLNMAGGALGGALLGGAIGGMPGVVAGGILGGIGPRRLLGGAASGAWGGAKWGLAQAGHVVAGAAGLQFDAIAGVAARQPGFMTKAGIGAAVGGAFGGLPGAVVGGMLGNRILSSQGARGSIFSGFARGAGKMAPLPRLLQAALKRPNLFGIGIGALLSIPTLVRGAVSMIQPERAGIEMSRGNMASVYGLDPNNLSTMNLVQALHLRR